MVKSSRNDQDGDYIMRVGASGFRELEHTADWELEVWAPDLTSLLEQAARGMYALAGVNLVKGPRQERVLVVQAQDAESLLVNYLTELLFLAEQEGLAFDAFELHCEENRLEARMSGAPIAASRKEIKAVTYHRMKIRETREGPRVNIVFDV